MLGPLLFKIFLTDIFGFFCPTEMVSYADDNTPHATGDCLKKTLQKVEKALNILALARIANYMEISKKRSTMNAFIISIHLRNRCLTIE